MDPHDFGRFFRGLLGFDRGQFGGKDGHGTGDDEGGGEDADLRRGSNSHHDGHLFNFQVFTDPIEIHKFFEKEMEQMFKDFGGLGGIIGQRKYLEEEPPSRFQDLPDPGQSDRDLMLKSDSEIVSPRFGCEQDNLKEDRDLDDQSISADQLDSLFKKNEGSGGRQNNRENEFPSWGMFGPPGSGGGGSGFHSYSFSKSIRSVQKPDGSIEIEEKTRNPDGTESVVIKRRVGDHEETIYQNGEMPSSSGSVKEILPYHSPRDEEGILSPYHPQQQDPMRQFQQMIPGFGHIFSGFFGGHHPYQEGHPPFGGSGGQPSSDMPPPPPLDRQFSSLFSKFFGDQRK